MILFAGSQERGFFVQETAAMKNMDLGYLEGSLTIQNHINGILNRQCDYLIFDIEQYVDPAEVVAAEIKRLERAKNCDVIIYAPGYDRQSRVIKELQYQGIVYYIFSANQTEARQELEQCLSGYYREPEQNATWEEQKEELKSGIKIGIAGVCRRMGTTTFAIQLVKYLQLKGHKACYLEVNDSGFVQKHEERFYAEAYDENLGKVTFEGVDMFYKPENLPEVLKQEYDYYIYDFGAYRDADFNKTSFLEKDIRIFVTGTKASEMDETEMMLRNEYYSNVMYVFNFTSEREKKDILEFMEERADRTFFTVYAPDQFEYVYNPAFERLFPVKEKEDRRQEKRRLLFGWKKSESGGRKNGKI